jgi:hypothetical protein
MCIKDKIWLKRFGLALLGVGLYLLDTGTDTWVGNSLIQNCHVKFGASVLCLVYVLPGVFSMINTIFHPKNDANCITGLAIGIFFVPFSICCLLWDLVTLDDEALEIAKT